MSETLQFEIYETYDMYILILNKSGLLYLFIKEQTDFKTWFMNAIILRMVLLKTYI